MINLNILLIFLIIGYIIYKLYKKKDEDDDENKYNKLSTDYNKLYNKFKTFKSDKKDNIKKIIRQNTDNKYYLDLLNKKALFNPLYPPETIDDSIQYLPSRLVKSIATRGISDYRYLGNLVNKDEGGKHKILNLVGRPTHRGSTKWQYYAVDPNNSHYIKYNIDKKRELYDNDIVNIREYSNLPWTFYKNENNNEIYRYDPYTFT